MKTFKTFEQVDGSLESLFKTLEEYFKKGEEKEEKKSKLQELLEGVGFKNIEEVRSTLNEVSPLYKEVKKCVSEDFGNLIKSVGNLRREEIRLTIKMLKEEEFSNEFIMEYLLKDKSDALKEISKVVNNASVSYRKKDD